ncbi:N-acetyltransferase [Novosphingobium sp. G106]|uniref:N-acetyltransferase n=1 Tax=Novosphingobium sp. G106 TaxID=2849500 RepID=UPI001C2CE3FB|nr:N-acetyltransferase [Novosphingobium sp. G106]MBV1690568.1 N-acetyltransferase [Novosphingobium sp. G106]
MSDIRVTAVATKADRKAFIDLPYRLNASDPHWVPPLKADVDELLNPKKNPFFEHAEVQLFLARRAGQVVGRISAHMDKLAWTLPPEQGMGPGTGNWGMFDAEDEAVAAALIAAAEDWLRAKGMTRVLAPLSLSIWDEPGLLVKGFDHDPVIMMGHNSPRYQAWFEGRGYTPAKTLLTYDLQVDKPFPPLIERIVASGEKNPRIRIREADKSRFKEEADLVFDILNDAWSTNWGFVPITDSEVRYVSKKMAPVVYPDLLRIAELDGEPVAFMLTFPDMNRVIKPFKGNLFPFNFIKLLAWVRKPKSPRMRVPLMGVRKHLQSSRMASQLAFMMIEYIRRSAVKNNGAQTAEIGWILDDNQGMRSVADAIDSKVNREYVIYEKPL